jgi:hypothetical protein
MAIGRIFRIKERAQFQIRAEFQNIFNRHFYQPPQDGSGFGQAPVFTTSPTLKANSLSGTSGLLSGGFGYVNWLNGGSLAQGWVSPRSGQIVARFTF